MVSQPPSESFEFVTVSFVRGYHAYMDVWEPQIGEVLTLEREPHNQVDRHAVSTVKSGLVVGHVPFNLAPVFSPFLKRSFNKGTAEITGGKVNRGAGYGLEVPCIYHLYGPKVYLERVGGLISGDVRKKQSSGVPNASQN